jgi:hypothetical protein
MSKLKSFLKKKQQFLLLCLFIAFLSTLNAQRNPLIRKPDSTVTRLSNLRLETTEQRIYFDNENKYYYAKSR